MLHWDIIDWLSVDQLWPITLIQEHLETDHLEGGLEGSVIGHRELRVEDQVSLQTQHCFYD